MTKLGSSFPPTQIEKHVKSILKMGAVLKLHSTGIRNPKIKRLIVIGTCNLGGRVGRVFINSKAQAPESQIHFIESGRPYLDHKSYVDCSSIYPDSYDAIFEKIKADLNCYIGKVSDQDMALLIQTLRKARTISKKEKTKFRIV